MVSSFLQYHTECANSMGHGHPFKSCSAQSSMIDSPQVLDSTMYNLLHKPDTHAFKKVIRMTFRSSLGRGYLVCSPK
jgi:predicted GNAT superfamily acetyltransferase